MQENDIDKKINEYIKSLPAGSLKIISSSSWREKTTEIGQKYSLSLEQKQIFEAEVFMLIIGLTTGEDLQKSLTDQLAVSPLLASQLVDELDERIFEPLFEELESGSGGEKQIKNEKRFSSQTESSSFPAIEEGEVAHNISSSEFGTKPASIGVPRYVPPANDSTSPKITSEVLTQQPETKPASRFQQETDALIKTSETSHESLANIALTRSPLKDSQSQANSLNRTPVEAEIVSVENSSSKSPSQVAASQKVTNTPENLPGIEIIHEKQYTSDPYREPIE